MRECKESEIQRLEFSYSHTFQSLVKLEEFLYKLHFTIFEGVINENVGEMGVVSNEMVKGVGCII